MDKTLQMTFQNKAGKHVSINISKVKDNISEDQIKKLMKLIVAKNIFDSKGGEIVSSVSAKVISKDTQEIKIA